MLQWVEIKRTEQASDGNKVWYQYIQQWSSKLIPHNNFDQQSGHENPRQFPCQNDTFTCENAYLGQYTLNLSQIARLNKSRDYRPNEDQRDAILKSTKWWLDEMGFDELVYKTQYFETRPKLEMARNLQPGIGTTRISWVYVPCGKMTVMA